MPYQSHSGFPPPQLPPSGFPQQSQSHVIYTQTSHEASSDGATATKNTLTLVVGLASALGLGSAGLVSHSSNADAAGAAAQNAKFAHNDVKELIAENALLEARLITLEGEVNLLKAADENIKKTAELHAKKRRH